MESGVHSLIVAEPVASAVCGLGSHSPSLAKSSSETR